jgi:hypothetical protein
MNSHGEEPINSPKQDALWNARPDLSRSSGALYVLLVFVTIGMAGCAHYQVGAETLYAPDVQTVFVPMIESDSFRRDLGERLTEAVVREIELKTPYKVVGSPDADAVLSVHLLNDARRVLVEDRFDAPRALENSLQAEVLFVNRRSMGLEPAPPVLLEVPPGLLIVGETSVMVPALGQTVTSSQQQAIERLAQEIVGRMEQPW